MKRTFIPYCLFLSLLIVVAPGVKSQDLFANADGERLEAFTDRTIYIAGEKIRFSATVFNLDQSPPPAYSKVFYCELITSDGNRVAGGKFLLQNNLGQGCLTIPEETISGIYFLKLYTRFMRNRGPDAYKYIMLKIVNPFKTDVVPGNGTIDSTRLETPLPETRYSSPSLEILSDKKIFSPREEIKVNITTNDASDTSSHLCLAVIPEFSYEEIFLAGYNKANTNGNGAYLPETRGVSLSGQLIGEETGKPIPEAKVYLSIIGNRDILVVRTDSSGKFFFALPNYYGNHDIFLCAEDLPDVTPELFIDNDFCPNPVTLPSPSFILNKEEMEAAYKLAVNSRVTDIFNPDIIPLDTMDQKENSTFYGKPTEVLILEKYIDLPALEEYFTELTPSVKVKREKGKKRFRFYTTLEEMSAYDPLVLVDWVAVDNMEKILQMSPLDIERIELVNAPYIKGDITYGGIVSFVSKKNDFAGIDLPTSGTFVNYTFLEECTKTLPSDSLNPYIPDSRNTVYWNPSLQPNPGGTTQISFTTPDTPGNYLIILRALNSARKVVTVSRIIEVKE